MGLVEDELDHEDWRVDIHGLEFAGLVGGAFVAGKCEIAEFAKNGIVGWVLGEGDEKFDFGGDFALVGKKLEGLELVRLREVEEEGLGED